MCPQDVFAVLEEVGLEVFVANFKVPYTFTGRTIKQTNREGPFYGTNKEIVVKNFNFDFAAFVIC